MKWDHIIKNGTIVTATETYKADIYVKDGKIAAITSENLGDDAVEVTDAAGKYVLPGFIDTHCHSRDGYKGAHYKEDFFHSSSAGAASGITTIYEMPNCNPAVYNVDRMNDLIECITPKAHTDFGVWGLCLGDLNDEEIPKLAEAGVVGFKFFWGYAISKEYQLIYNYEEGMKDVIPPLDMGQVYKIFRTVAKTGKMVGIHAENFDIIKQLTAEVVASGDKSYDAMLRARPPFSETTIIESAISLSRELGTRLHILHLAAGDGVDLIRIAQAEGLNVTVETCAQYLALTNVEAAKLGSVVKGYPPIRTKYDQDKLFNGLMDGTLSFIASDHAPHSPEEKAADIWNAPAGAATIETMPLVLIDMVSQGKMTLNKLVQVLSEKPAKMYGTYPVKGAMLPGADADFVVLDMDKEYVFHQEDMHSRTKMSPYDGWTFKGKPVKTILRGMTTAENGQIVGGPKGHFVKAVDNGIVR